MQFFGPHPKQVDLLASGAPVRAFLGGNRSGKTTVGIVDDIIQALDASAVPAHLQRFKRFEAPFYCRIIAPDFTSTMEGVIFQKIREWCPRAQLVGNGWERGFDKQQRVLRFKNGSWFQFMTFEQDLDKFGGAALHRVHYDEEPPEQIRRECVMRLIDYAGEELFTMTPLHGMSWMYDGVWRRRHEDGYYVVTVDMDDNPHLNEAAKLRALEGLSAEERDARKRGLFVHFAGLIYPDFDVDVHTLPERDVQRMITPESSVYVGIDPGQRNAAAAVFVLVEPDDQLIVFDEIALERRTVGEMAREIHLRLAKWAVTPRLYVIDPSARNKVHQTGRSDQMEYADHGIVAIPGQNAVTAGINRVKERLQSQPPRLMVSRACPGVIDEFRRYRWATQLRSENDPKEAPVKKDDHRLDALRYVVMARPYRNPDEAKQRADEPVHLRLIREDLDRGNVTRIGSSQGGPGRFF